MVLSNVALTAKDIERSREERAAAEARHRDALRMPRRPGWDRGMSAEVLDHRERDAFLAWRRRLAAVEEEEGLVLTPFEKNLEVWRQLWRVMERSDIVVQVVDSRDPLRYRCRDLEEYAAEMSDTKRVVLLLNKADLLPPFARRAWADHFDAEGTEYLFWSARQAQDEAELEQTLEREAGMGMDLDVAATLAARRERLDDSGGDERIRVRGRHELLDEMHTLARRAIEAGGPGDAR